MCAGVGPGHPTPVQDRSSATERPLKFSVPVATHVVDRPRLDSRLAHGVGVGTVLVAAPAGWGKTLLAASCVEAGLDDRSWVWVSLDPDDDDEHAFWRTLATALLDVADETTREALRRVTVAGGANLPSLFVAGVRMLPHKAVLVLDNLHEVRTPEVHAGLLQLVERPLPTLSLVVITRQDPPWPLQRLRLAGVLSEVRSADLAFRTDEAGLLFGGLGLGLSDPQVNRLLGPKAGLAARLRAA